MRKFLIYLKLQQKRLFQNFLPILLITFLMAGLIGVSAVMQWNSLDHSDGTTKISLGLTGNTKGSYLDFGIFALENLDASRFTLNLLEMEEEEAKKALDDGTISGYVVIPDDFMNSVSSGENSFVTYVCKSSQAGLDGLMIRELADSVSRVVMDTETGMYAAYDFYAAHDLNDKAGKEVKKLNLAYFNQIFDRLRLYDIQEKGNGSSISTEGYYLCAIGLFFLLLWGINCASTLISKDPALARLLSSTGLGSARQVLAEFTAYLALMMVCILCLASAGTAITLYFGGAVSELNSLTKGICFLAGMIPVCLLTAAFHYLIFSSVSGLKDGLLLNFTLAVAAAFLSGCFYPLSYYPKLLQRICAVLPFTRCLKYMQNLLMGADMTCELMWVLFWTIVFLVLSCIMKTFRIRKMVD